MQITLALALAVIYRLLSFTWFPAPPLGSVGRLPGEGQ